MKSISRVGVIIVVIAITGGLTALSQRSITTTYTVINTSDSGAGSLRQAIIDANNHTGPDVIAFDIPTSDPNYNATFGWWLIQPASLLPSLSEVGTHINGKTQAENHGNTNPFGPEILLSGSLLGGSMCLLTIESDDNQVEGLTINSAPGAGVNIIAGAENNTVIDNYIGTDPKGTSGWGNDVGVKLSSGATQNYITDNLISGNDTDGILVTGTGTDENYICRNTIGLTISGNAVLPNAGNGISIANNAAQTQIGTTFMMDDCGNTISGNLQHGVSISGSDTHYTHVRENYIGVNSSGGGLPGLGNHLSGVHIEAGADNSSIILNVISGNQDHGIYITGGNTDDNSIFDNIIGADKDLTALIPNHHHGVAIYAGAQNNEIGCKSSGWPGNVVVGNGWSGIVIYQSHYNEVYDNAVGTDWKSWASNLGNKYFGIAIKEGTGNTIWYNRVAYNGTFAVRAGIQVDAANENTISRNWIHDNSGDGIELINGANNNITVPTISMANCNEVKGSACAGCTVEIFSDRNGEGRYYEGDVKANDILPSFHWTGSPGSIEGPNVTATVTDSQGNTSEFSLPYVNACLRLFLPLTLRNYN